MIIARLGAEHSVDALQAARREFVVVPLVAGRGPREHDVVAVLAARRAVPVVFRVVLRSREQQQQRVMTLRKQTKSSLYTHRRSKVVADLVSERHVRHRGRDVLAVVEQGDDPRVEAL